MHHYRIELDSLRWETPAAGVRFKAFRQDNRKVRLVEYTRQFAEKDWCVKGHVGYVIEGRLEIDFNGRVLAYNPGDAIMIPAGEEHRHKARILTERAVVFLTEDAI